MDKKNKTFKETDIRPDEIMDKQLEFMDADRHYLLSHKNNFVKINCPACGNKNSKKSFSKNGLQYVSCIKCDTLYINPRPSPEILSKLYAQSAVYEYWNKYVYPASDKARRKFIFRPRVDKIFNFCKKYKLNNPTLMEVGAGYGTFCKEASKLDFFKKIIAVEPTSNGAESCRKKGIDVIQDQIENVSIKNKTVDIVVSFEVIEHLFSPKIFLESCFKLLRKPGLIVVTCPNSAGFDNLVLGSKSSSFDHEHLNFFNPDSLALLLTNCGFKVVEKLTPGKLDAELVRKQVLKGNYSLENQPFLNKILIEEWDELGLKFQQFLSENLLSGHLWVVASKL